ncbi:MAG TPA: hypothetical protein VEN79_13465 [Terriglobia bacterium]|nr:hypothetical protein [Terriglobia bacterium]
MLIFDRIRLQDLDRRNWQLWVLAIGMILVLSAGLAVHMYTLVSASAFSISRHAMLQGIIGFCILSTLFVGYLIDRQMVIARLRRELIEEKKHNLERRTQGNKELLQALSGPVEFGDRLALEIQRAANRKLPLSGLTITLEVLLGPSNPDEVYSAFGEAVKAMMDKLRGEDSIYQFTSGVFGVLLPGAGPRAAHSIAVRVAGGLNEAMGISRRYSFDIRITTFPNQAKTAPEMEQLMRMTRAA